MTDTPPYYWFNGEDGPQEEESRPPPDGVLAARPMAVKNGSQQQNGKLNGIELSRNEDKKRHGCLDGKAPNTPSANGVDVSGMPGGGIRPVTPLQVPGLTPMMPQFSGGGANVQRSSSIGPPQKARAPSLPGSFAACHPGAAGAPHVSLFGGPPLPTPQQTWFQRTQSPHSTAAQSMRWATSSGAAPPPWAHGSAQSRGPVCTPTSVQNRPRSPAPSRAAATPPAPPLSPASWTRRLSLPGANRGELQSASSFQKSKSFVMGSTPSHSSSFTHAAPENTANGAPSPQAAPNSFVAAAPPGTPMSNGIPTANPPGPLSANGSFVGASPALPSRPLMVSPPSGVRACGGNSYTQAAPPQAPHVVLPAPAHFNGGGSGMWSTPIPSMAVPRPSTPMMESRGVGSSNAGLMPEPRPLHPVLPAQEKAYVRQRSVDSRAKYATPTASSPWGEVQSASQSPAMSSYSFGQARATAPPVDRHAFPAPPASFAENGNHAPAHSRHTAPPASFAENGNHAHAHSRHPVPPASFAENGNHAHAHSRHPRIAKNEAIRVLVTGATGLLGRQVLQALSGFNVRGLCRSRGQRPPLVACDLTAEGEAARRIEEWCPHVVVHLAGERRPDVLRRSPARSRLLNVDATGAIAAACEFGGSWLIFVSADAVFDGTAPPYAEDNAPNPVSEYGWHKLHAEKLVLATCPRAAILRVPSLYGPVEYAAESVVTEIYSELRIGTREMGNWQRCYPTWTCDVALVLRAMVDLHVNGTVVQGIFHWQGSEQFTKYEIAVIIASACGFPPPIPVPRTADASGLVAEDARLECSRLQSLFASVGFKPVSTPLRIGLENCLAVFHDGPLNLSYKPTTATREAPSLSKSVSQGRIGANTKDECNETTQAPSTPMSMPTQAPSTPMSMHDHGEQPNQFSVTRESSAPTDASAGREQHRLQSLGLRGEDGHAARAAALKNVFREELELAWRRYRDAACDGKPGEEMASRPRHNCFGQGEHRGVLV